MRRAILSACLLLISSCASVSAEGFYSCDAVRAGDIDSRFTPSRLWQPAVIDAVRRALDAATFTTDYRLHDTLENCRKLIGLRIYTKSTPNWIRDSDGLRVSGEANCQLNMVTIGTPEDGDFHDSALVHELFHVMQGCEGTPPADDPAYAPGHENWIRDGIFNAIDAARKP